MDSLQTALNLLQMSLFKFKLVLKSKKTKFMTSMHSCSLLIDYAVLMLDVTHLDRVTAYKYLGICLDDKLNFDVHIDSLLKKTSTKIKFFISINFFSFTRRKRFV